jgi:hypothetical protein
LAPPSIAELLGPLGRTHDIGEQDRGEETTLPLVRPWHVGSVAHLEVERYRDPSPNIRAVRTFCSGRRMISWDG